MLDLLFSKIVRDFLDTAESHAAGVPASTDCALLRMDSGEDDVDPRICLVADEQGGNRSKQIHVVAVCRGTQLRSITDPWLDKVKDRLYNQTALCAFIAALPLDQRTGYQIERISPPGAAKVQREENGPIETGVGIIFFVTI